MKVTEKDLIDDIKNYPIEVVQRMTECQVEQGNNADLSKIKRDKPNGGFNWDETKEGLSFWYNIIVLGKYTTFFQLCPKQEPKPYPKVMLVWDEGQTIEAAVKRVVFMEKKGKFISWLHAETIEDSKNVTLTYPWNFAQDIPELPEKVTIKEKAIEVGGVELSIQELENILNQLKNEKD